MYNYWQTGRKYINYYLSASNSRGHGVHSPFIFDFITRVLNDKRHFYIYDEVEGLRRRLLRDGTKLEIEDLGAGSSSGHFRERSIRSIARHAVKPRKWGQLLFRMAHYYHPSSILELGTSLGVTTAYLAMANPASRVTTIEGSPAIAQKAAQHFRELGLLNIALHEGNIDHVLPAVMAGADAPDMVFIDGNHRLEPTLAYFEQLIAKKNNNSIFIFDDIHWSAGMEKAWDMIRSHPDVRASVDLFSIGMVFFREEFLTKQHFTIRF